jgi:hypothetical protein
MRRFLAIFVAVLLAGTLSAQQRTGNIFGKVVDNQGQPLPGVAVTLRGLLTAPVGAVTSDAGTFRFLSLAPSKDYELTLELTGFKTKTEKGIIVNVGTNVELSLALEQGVLQESITVTAKTPVVDPKKTSIGTNFTQDILQSLPSARDPWVVLQMAPSVIMDRENIGGAESGQQSTYVARGATNYNNNVWAMDGIVITDPAAIGSSPSYYDFDAFEEMQITVGGADVTTQTGGVALNMVTRRGGNKLSLGGRFYFLDEMFQADNFKEEFRLQGAAGVNKIRRNKDYGFNVGGPLIKDKAWFWGSYGVQDLKNVTVLGTPDDTLLENFVAKLNIQLIPQNRFEAFVHSGGKMKWGRSVSVQNPEGLNQTGRYHFGSPIIKLQDEHMFGDDLFVTLKFAYTDSGFNLMPRTDPAIELLPVWDVTANRWYGSQANYYHVERPVYQYSAMLNFFSDGFLGAKHDVKAGFEYAERNQYVQSTWSGNMRVNRNYNTPTVDFTGDGQPDVPTTSNFKWLGFQRGYYRDQHIDALAGYLSDTVSFGRFNLTVGLRWDRQTPVNNPYTVTAVDKNAKAWRDNATSETADKLSALLPDLKIPVIESKARDGSLYRWDTWSPRFGLTWDIAGDGKTVAKLSFNQTGDFMGTGIVDNWSPGGTGGTMGFWWWDNGDNRIDWRELYWATYRSSPRYQLYRAFDDSGNFVGNWADAAGSGTSWNAAGGGYWNGFEYANPSGTTAPYVTLEANAGSTRKTEFQVSLDREIFADFSVSAVGSYVRYDKFNWNLRWFPATGVMDNQSWYVSAGKVAATIPGLGGSQDAANHEWYTQTPEATAYTPHTITTPRQDFYQDYFGLDLIFNKRLSNKWMMTGSVTLLTQAQHFGDKGYVNPTNLWAYEGRDSSALIGSASGLLDQYTNARWMARLGGLYQLPFDFNVSFSFRAREGWIQRESFTIVDYTQPNPLSQQAQLDMSSFGTLRLSPEAVLDIKVEKVLKLGDSGRLHLVLDVFNLLNSDTIVRRQQKFHGTYYKYANPALDRWVPWTYNNNIDGILTPRCLRFGVRFTI